MRKVCEPVKFVMPIFASMALSISLSASDFKKEFETKVRPLLEKYCLDCHDPDDEDNESPFLEALTLEDIGKYRSSWKSTAAQLRNRTMPPKRKKKQPTEFERVEIATWIDNYLRQSALDMPEYAGSITTRRLNRDEYNNTIRDLVGLDLGFSASFPMDGGGGEGFDNNGETLFLPPLLMERYLEAAEHILDKAVILPELKLSFDGSELKPATSNTPERTLEPGENVFQIVSIGKEGEYLVGIKVSPLAKKSTITLKLDGITAHKFTIDGKSNELKAKIRLTRGMHSLALVNSKKFGIVQLHNLTVNSIHKKVKESEQKVHDGIFKHKPSSRSYADLKTAAYKNIKDFTRKAFRKPVSDEQLQKYIGLYERAAQRGDSYEASVKLALKAVLVSPNFIFMIENMPSTKGIHQISNYELASRLSYFLWVSMPDEELFQLAEKKQLSKPEVLRAQVERMLKDKKAFEFYTKFTGQWLGTKDVGGKIAPLGRGTDIGYTPELGVSLREEPVYFMQYLIQNNKSLLEMIETDFAILNDLTAKHYKIKDVKGRHFRYVKVDGVQRGGVLGLGGVHMVTSFPQRTSPVLRGAWVIETLLGTPVPSPPDNVPELKKKRKKEKLTIRQIFEKHRSNDACSACHNLIDPIGFGLENYDLLGRWRTHEDGVKVDASGIMPSGEKFEGPAELRKIILMQKDAFARHFTGKVLGFALGRSLLDEDAGTIERIVGDLKHNNYSSQYLISSIVMSTPFRNRQMVVHRPAKKAKKH